jgi:hypothetical protein
LDSGAVIASHATVTKNSIRNAATPRETHHHRDRLAGGETGGTGGIAVESVGEATSGSGAAGRGSGTPPAASERKGLRNASIEPAGLDDIPPEHSLSQNTVGCCIAA